MPQVSLLKDHPLTKLDDKGLWSQTHLSVVPIIQKGCSNSQGRACVMEKKSLENGGDSYMVRIGTCKLLAWLTILGALDLRTDLHFPKRLTELMKALDTSQPPDSDNHSQTKPDLRGNIEILPGVLMYRFL